MTVREQEQILCMLFSDLKGYSGLKNDKLKNNAVKDMKQIVTRSLEPSVQVIKEMGDGLMICSYTALPLAESALRIRDFFKTTDWKGKGYPEDFRIRIALHVDEMVVHYNEDNTIKDAYGSGVDATARIEPVTEPNAVYCSSRFFDMLQRKGSGKIKGVSKGNMSLAKNYGDMELFELKWINETDTLSGQAEQKASSSPVIPMPSIKKPFTDKDRRDYLRYAFGVIANYFEAAINQLNASSPQIEAELTRINDIKLTCEIYIDGQSKASGKIWIGSMMRSDYEQIQFSEGRFSINDDNSYNDSIILVEDGSELALKSQLGMTSFIRKGPDISKPSSPEQIAEYLWIRLSRPLEY